MTKPCKTQGLGGEEALHEVANGVLDRQMEFLDMGGASRGDDEAEIGQCGDLTTTFSGQGDDFDPFVVGHHRRSDDVFALPRGRMENQQVVGRSQGINLSCKDVVEP